MDEQDTKNNTSTSCGEGVDSKPKGPSLYEESQDREQDISTTNTEGQDMEVNTSTEDTEVHDGKSNTSTTDMGCQDSESDTPTTDMGDNGVIQKGRLVTYSVERRDEFLTKLREQNEQLPCIKRHSKRSVIHHLAAEIESLLNKGYNYKQIAETLKGIGFDIDSGTLQNYLQDERRRNGQVGKRKRKGRDTQPTNTITQKEVMTNVSEVNRNVIKVPLESETVRGQRVSSFGSKLRRDRKLQGDES